MAKGELKKIEFSDDALLAIGSTVGSLIGYHIGRKQGDGIPPMLIGGMAGTLIVILMTKNK